MYTKGKHTKYYRLDIFIMYYLWLGNSLLSALSISLSKFCLVASPINIKFFSLSGEGEKLNRHIFP